MHTHARVDDLIMRLGAESVVPLGKGEGLYRAEKANKLKQYLIENPAARTPDDEFMIDAVVREAASMPSSISNERFSRALEMDGFTLVCDDEEGKVEFRRMLPDVADLPQARDEVHALLDELGMSDAKEHLDQAIDNHARGQWAAANGELRKVLEYVLDEVAARLHPGIVLETPKGHARRQLLANREPKFLLQEIGEWSGDGKNFVNGVFKRLHPQGGHPGLSDEEDCTFRLHLVLVVARLFLRRAKAFGEGP